jgi:CBS domain-containing protein
MEQLAARHVGGAPVMSGDRVIGVLSSTDINDFLASQPGVPEERGEAASIRGEPDEEPTSTWREGDEPLSAFFNDLWSNAGAPTDARMNSADSPEWNMLEEHTVSEAMNFGVISLRSTATIDEAAERMRAANVHRILVIDDDKLVGIVSATDVADSLIEDAQESGASRRTRSTTHDSEQRSEL